MYKYAVISYNSGDMEIKIESFHKDLNAAVDKARELCLQDIKDNEEDESEFNDDSDTINVYVSVVDTVYTCTTGCGDNCMMFHVVEIDL